MKRVNDLYHQIYAPENLLLAARKALRGKKYLRTGAYLNFNLEKEILELHDMLLSEQIVIKPYTTFIIREPKLRTICSANIRDRVLHHAILNILEPVLEKRLIYHTFACRKGKGLHSAVKWARSFVQKNTYYLKCDIDKYFDTIDHEVLVTLLGRITKDKKLLNLLEVIIRKDFLHLGKDKGLPIGNLTSQHFANLYLGELDLFIKHELKCRSYVRYMDDFLLFSSSKLELKIHLARLKEFAENRLKLKLKERVTRVAPVFEGVPFLGFRIFRNLIRLKRENLVRLRRKVVLKQKLHEQGRISTEELEMSVRSMLSFVSHADTVNLRRSLFMESDRSWL